MSRRIASILLVAFQAELLAGMHRYDEADAKFRAAIHMDTDFALPYAMLGQTADQRHDTLLAISTYREYLARASRKAADRDWVERRLRNLTTER